MKSIDKAVNLAMLHDSDAKCVDLWEGEPCGWAICIFLRLLCEHMALNGTKFN